MEDQITIKTNAGVQMPWIVYGTAWKKERTTALVEQAVDSGFRGIDTACQPRHYSEAGAGEALTRLGEKGVERSSLFLQTKFTPAGGQDPETIPYDPKAPVDEQVAQSVEVSMQNLKTEVIDSLVLHSPLDTHEETMLAWGAMEKIHAAGGVRQLGISNCYDLRVLKALHADAEVKPAVVQNRFYERSGYDRELRAWCREQGIVNQTFWTLTANPHVLESEVVRGLAEKHGRTPAQVFFAFVHQSGMVPLTGTTSPEHMAQDLAVVEFALSAEDVVAVDGLLVPA
jgi:diketogulonate reductase-like aldo/keto reductase